MIDEAFIRDRITQLRIRKGVSEYHMSYDLGHSRSYVFNISSGKALPPMKEFLAIGQSTKNAQNGDNRSCRRRGKESRDNQRVPYSAPCEKHQTHGLPFGKPVIRSYQPTIPFKMIYIAAESALPFAFLLGVHVSIAFKE